MDTWPAEDDGPAQNLWLGHFSAHDNEMGRITILRHGGRPLNHSMIISVLPPRGGVIAGLADGHAEFSYLPTLWTYNWHRGWAQSLKVSIGAAP